MIGKPLRERIIAENTRLRSVVAYVLANLDAVRAAVEAGFVEGKNEDATRRHERYVSAYATLDSRTEIEANRLRDALAAPWTRGPATPSGSTASDKRANRHRHPVAKP